MAVLSLDINDEIEQRAENVCNDLGISITTAVSIYLQKLGREGQIPFKVKVDPFYSKENMELLERSARQMELTGGTVHEV